MSEKSAIELMAIESAPAALDHDLQAIWNQSWGDDFQIASRVVTFCLQPGPDTHSFGYVALSAGEPVGFVLASAQCDATSANAAPVYIDALAVLPDFQRDGIGSALLGQIEQGAEEAREAGKLRRADALTFVLGGSAQSLLPGLPELSSAELFFVRRGYHRQPQRIALLSANLSSYQPPEDVEKVAAAIRPGQPGQVAQLQTLLAEFPSAWQRDLAAHLEQNGRISDYMLVWTAEGVEGFCRILFEDSIVPIERVYPYRLPRLWGQLGPIGISRAARGRGLGRALVDAGLRRLHSTGVNGCIIGPTRERAFFHDFGFGVYAEFVEMRKAAV